MQRCSELDEDHTIKASEKISMLAQYGDSLGFSLAGIMEDIDVENGSSKGTDNRSDDHRGVSAKETEAQETLNKLRQSFRVSSGDTLGRRFSSSNRLSLSRRFSSSSRLSESDRSGKGSSPPSKKPQLQKRISVNARHWNSVIDGFGKRDSGEMMRPAFQPWDKNESQERCVKRLDNNILATWGVMYCGGSKPVIASLRELSQEYNIDLHIDSFKW